MPHHTLASFEIHMYYQNKPKFNGVYWGSNLTKIKDGAYVINFDEFKSIVAHWITLFVKAENVTHFHNFGAEYILKKIGNSLEIKILQWVFIE